MGQIGRKITQPTRPAYHGLGCGSVRRGSTGTVRSRWPFAFGITRVTWPRRFEIRAPFRLTRGLPAAASQLKPAESFEFHRRAPELGCRQRWRPAWFLDLQWHARSQGRGMLPTPHLPGDAAAQTLVCGSGWQSYAFRLRALDANSQPEPWPAGEAFETSATLPATCLPRRLRTRR